MGGGAGDPSIAGQVAMGVQQGMQASGLQGGTKGIGPNGKPTVKPDIVTIATDVFQLKKMLFAIMRHANIELPPDVLDGPNRDPQTGAPAEGQSGGSDVAPGGSMNPQSAIRPIEPMAGAFPGGGAMGGMGGGRMKTSSDLFTKTVGREIAQDVTGDQVMSKAAAVALMCRRRREVIEKSAFRPTTPADRDLSIGREGGLLHEAVDSMPISDSARDKANKLRKTLHAMTSIKTMS
jgi:hypothetical protein